MSTRKALILITLFCIADQCLKFWIKLTLPIGGFYEVLPFFEFRFVENNGFAFGLEFGGEFGKIMLNVIRFAAVFFLIRWMITEAPRKRTNHFIWALIFILAGAIGNVFDSMFYGMLFSDSQNSIATFMPESGGYAPFLYGKVVDMFYFKFYHGTWPDWIPLLGGSPLYLFRHIFNLADAFITTGFLIMVIWKKECFITPKELYH